MMTTKALFVKQSIEIKTPAEKVWQVLTRPELTRQWVSEFFGGTAELVSDWKLGSPVEWSTLSDGKVRVEGTVIAVEPNKLLHYTVFDVNSERVPVTDEDGITFTLFERDGWLVLSVVQGDFGKMEDGEKYYNASVPIWQKVLPKIKAAAESLPD